MEGDLSLVAMLFDKINIEKLGLVWLSDSRSWLVSASTGVEQRIKEGEYTSHEWPKISDMSWLLFTLLSTDEVEDVSAATDTDASLAVNAPYQ